MIAQADQASPIVQILPLLLLVAIFYFLLIRPQQRRMRAQRALIESLEVGDEVLTIGGLFGTVTALDEEAFEVEISPGTRVRLLKSAVSRRLGEEPVAGGEEANGES